MSKPFMLDVISPDRAFYSGETEMLIANSVDGYMAVMYDMEPSVVPLKVGSLRIKNPDGSFSWAACSAGLLTVKDTKATLLVDSVEWVDEIDIERAIGAKERAEERLQESTANDIDFMRARAALERAINRIKLGNKRK